MPLMKVNCCCSKRWPAIWPLASARCGFVMNANARNRRYAKTEALYEELYENAPNGYVSLSPEDGRLLQFNQALCTMLGYDRADLSGPPRPFSDLCADDTDGANGRPVAEHLLRRFVPGEDTRTAELHLRHAEGHSVWVSISADPVVDAQGKVTQCRSSLDRHYRAQTGRDRAKTLCRAIANLVAADHSRHCPDH